MKHFLSLILSFLSPLALGANQTLSTRLNVGVANVYVPNTSAGLVAAPGVIGQTTTTAVTAGYVGEVITGSSTNQTFTTTLTSYANVPITPGVWLVQGTGILSSSAGPSHTVIDCSVTTTLNGVGTNPVSRTQGAANSGGYGQAVVLPQVFSVSSTTTVYISCRTDVTSGGSGDGAYITALRIH